MAVGKSLIAMLAVGAALFTALELREPTLVPVAESLTADSVPRTLEEAFVVLAKALPADDLAAMQQGPESKMILYHHGLGTWIRNRWGLWRGGALYSYFEAMGLQHPDDMSGLILTSFWRHLHREPLRLEEQVRYYQDYWRAAKKPDPHSNPECPSGIHIVMTLDRPADDGTLRMFHMGQCCTDARVWAYERERGWHAPEVEHVATWNRDPDSRYDPCEESASPSERVSP